MKRDIPRLAIIIITCMFFYSCGTSIRDMLEPGVSIELAGYRQKQISKVSYDLFFTIPESPDTPITGKATIRFHQARAMIGVILDFQGSEEMIDEVLVNGVADDYETMNGHIIISSRHIIPSMNELQISFTASDQALNRSSDFMYTLFVPDKASTAFPCFDQPDIKATFSLSLDIPQSWTSVSNSRCENTSITGDRKTMVFSAGQPISTYLFAFAAGRFDTVTDSTHGRTMTIFHRETDTGKLERNADRIFQQHADALNWLEAYTSIGYPFAKLDMVLIPGFQYGGMEHPGAIFYRDIRVLLDEQAPISQQLAKANLIAHETAHMWFGDLVTMKWFDDVWLKEVFAGFMADKIVNPQFPAINHDLQFLLTHYPRALAVDRTKGTHPIKQDLTNMKQAGSLYGAIIYNKAPIVFDALERIMGEKSFREAVIEYLEHYYFDNADWDDLATIFDAHTTADIHLWSQQWIYGTGMPEIYTQDMNEDFLRAAMYIEDHEAFLHTNNPAPAYFSSLLQKLTEEQNPQIVRYLINNIQSIYWQFLLHEQRLAFAGDVEKLLWDRLEMAESHEKPVYLEAYTDMALTTEGTGRLAALFLSDISIDELVITEEHRFNIFMACKLRNMAQADEWITVLINETSNPDRHRRIRFLEPALSADPSHRDAFFQSLRDPANRRPEPWALEGLKLLHHPLRRDTGQAYVAESLEMLEEIHRTGDIFFPLRWLDATLGSYGDPETAATVEAYLEMHPGLTPSLRLKVLQAADLLFRSADRAQ